MNFCFLSSSYFKFQTLDHVIDECRRHRIKHVELSAPHPHIPQDELKKQLLGYRKEGFHLILHNYFPAPVEDFVLNLASRDSQVQLKTKNLVEGALELSMAVDAPIYGIHYGYLADAHAQKNGLFAFSGDVSSKQEAIATMVERVKELSETFKQRKVDFLLENLFPFPQENYCLGCTFSEIKDIMEQLPAHVGLLLDLGHVQISGNLLGFDKDEFLDQYLTAFGPRLLEVHCSENNSQKDEHLPVGKGSWQLQAIRKINQSKPNDSKQRYFCLEARKSDHFDDILKSLDLIQEAIF